MSNNKKKAKHLYTRPTKQSFAGTACPDHSEKQILFSLLEVEKNTGIKLTENLSMHPASSVCGFYFSHPQSHYFGIGKIDADQIADYAKRKNIPLEDLHKWLAGILQ